MTTNEAKILLPNEQVASDYCRIYYEVDLSKESCDRVAVKFSLHLPSQIGSRHDEIRAFQNANGTGV